jgi:hypothetical protein
MDEARDEFGLPRCVLLVESEEEFRARMIRTQAAIDRVVAAALRQVDGDRKIVEKMVRQSLTRQAAKRKGRPPKQKRNHDLRAQLASKKGQGETKTAAIQAVAEIVAPSREDADGNGYESTERQLWRLDSYDKKDAARAEEDLRKWAKSVMGTTDVDTALAEYHRRLVDSFVRERD